MPRGRTQEWVMDPCKFEQLFEEMEIIPDDCKHFKGYQIAELYFKYDQKCTELKMKLYRDIDRIVSESCPGYEEKST
ncbi:MAG: hypothetical protein JW965_06425 [Bacteroidales bacterium]|nr:hypothetical protein [Bacteroidales bacterium]